jgi:hypothetical protein
LFEKSENHTYTWKKILNNRNMFFKSNNTEIPSFIKYCAMLEKLSPKSIKRGQGSSEIMIFHMKNDFLRIHVYNYNGNFSNELGSGIIIIIFLIFKSLLM